MSRIEIGSKSRGRPKVPCGDNAPTVVIASIGTSSREDPTGVEVEKARAAAGLGAHAVTDHSFYGDIPDIHKALVEGVDALISTVGCYEFAARYQKRDWKATSPRAAIDILAEQVDRGVDMITVHASLTRDDVAFVDRNDRLIPSTSKGGSIVSNYMRTSKRENPYYEYFDDLLAIFAPAGVTLSLGTTFRAASVCDGWDRLMLSETRRMGELVRRATSAGVAVMIEGLGHASISAIPTYIQLAKSYCDGAPYRILPMATDRALGYDHISGAIATANAVMGGADAVTAMSRAEHIGLPNKEDMEEAITATKVAVACGELGRNQHLAEEQQMSRTRWAQGCKGDWTVAIHPAGAEQALEARGRLDDQRIQCSMCGDYCGITGGRATVALGPARLRDA